MIVAVKQPCRALLATNERLVGLSGGDERSMADSSARLKDSRTSSTTDEVAVAVIWRGGTSGYRTQGGGQRKRRCTLMRTAAVSGVCTLSLSVRPERAGSGS